MKVNQILSNQMRIQACSVLSVCLTVTLSAALGCTSADMDGLYGEPERVGKVRSAVTLATDFSSDTPTVGFGQGTQMVMRRGLGTDADALLDYRHFGEGPWLPSSPGPQPISSHRPFTWWQTSDTITNFTRIFSDGATAHERIKDELLGSADVLPEFPTLDVIGPPSALLTRELTNSGKCLPCVFGLYDSASGPKIFQSCIPGDHWKDWGLELPYPSYPASNTFFPTTSPVALHRSANSDSLWYACEGGGGAPTQVCEYRLGGPGATSNDPHHTDFGPGTFMAGTRPTALTKPGAERWVFAAVENGQSRDILARRESSGVDATGLATYYAVETIAHSDQSDVRYSTPMPYYRTDELTTVIYLRTEGSGNTQVMEAVWTGFDWSSSVIYDVGQQLPVGYEPVPYVAHLGEEITTTSEYSYCPFRNPLTTIDQNRVAFRLPTGVDALDTMELMQLPNLTYAALVLPPDGGGRLGATCQQNSDCDSNECQWSPFQVRKICVDEDYLTFSFSNTYLRSFDEVTPLPTEGGEDPAWQVTTGELYEPSNVSSGSSEGSSLIYSNAVIADGWVQVDAHSSDNDRQGVIFRYEEPGHYYLFSMTETSWALWRFDGEDTRTTLTSGAHSLDWSDTHTLRLEGNGPFLAVYIDGLLKDTVADDTYRSGRVGVYERDQQFAYFDNFHAVDATIASQLGTIQIKAYKDALLRGGSYANDNYGSYTHYYMKANNNLSYARKFGIGFDVSGVGTVTSASLNLVDFIGTDAPYDTSLRVYGVHEDQGDDWDESEVTWNDFPGLDPTDGYGTDSSIATSLGTITIEEGQDDGNHGLSLHSKKLIDFLNEDMDGHVTFLITTNSKYHTGNIAARDRSGSCKLDSTAQAGDCAPTLDITARPW